MPSLAPLGFVRSDRTGLGPQAKQGDGSAARSPSAVGHVVSVEARVGWLAGVLLWPWAAHGTFLRPW